MIQGILEEFIAEFPYDLRLKEDVTLAGSRRFSILDKDEAILLQIVSDKDLLTVIDYTAEDTSRWVCDLYHPDSMNLLGATITLAHYTRTSKQWSEPKQVIMLPVIIFKAFWPLRKVIRELLCFSIRSRIKKAINTWTSRNESNENPR